MLLLEFKAIFKCHTVDYLSKWNIVEFSLKHLPLCMQLTFNQYQFNKNQYSIAVKNRVLQKLVWISISLAHSIVLYLHGQLLLPLNQHTPNYQTKKQDTKKNLKSNVTGIISHIKRKSTGNSKVILKLNKKKK